MAPNDLERARCILALSQALHLLERCTDQIRDHKTLQELAKIQEMAGDLVGLEQVRAAWQVVARAGE